MNRNQQSGLVIRMKKICIIGKNSTVVRSVNWKSNFSLVSHTEIFELDLETFDSFVVFSWSSFSREDNLKVFELIKHRRVIFISSISVLSLLVRPQWNPYPSEKSYFESLYWSAGASIVRLGICFDTYKSSVPYTSPDAIFSALEACLNTTQQKLVTPVFIKEKGNQSFIETIMHRLSFFSENRIWRMMCEGAVKFCLRRYTPLYGYTADCTNLLVKPIQLGYGAVGSQNPEARKCQIVVDPRPNFKLERNGFRDTWIGRDIIGLSRLWHGVRIVKKGDEFYKNVPFWVKRKKAPFDTISKPVISIDLADRTINVETNLLISPYIPYRRLYIAMGALQNAIELSKNLKTSISLSDHSIASIGALKTRELVGMGYLKKTFFLLAGRKVFVCKDKEFMLDFRPQVDGDDNLGDNFYNLQAAGVIQKIFQRFSFSRLNQAFFNKFGICIWVDEMDVWVQVLMRDCIAVNGDKVIKKKDNAKLAQMLEEVKVQFPNIRMKKNISLFDAQHIMGGKSFLEENSLESLKEQYGVEIIGVPNEMELDALHHTSSLIDHTSKTKR